MSLTISVVTPTLNAAPYLPGCIESVRAQQAAGFELEHLVVDGGSTDGTVEIAQAAGCVLLQGKDRHIFDAINKGSRASSGDLIGFLGADDRLLPGALARVMAWFPRRRADWVIGGLRWTDGVGRPLGDIASPPRWMTPAMYASLGWSCVHHQSTYMTRGMFQELGGFHDDFRYAGDYEFFARALTRSTHDRIDHPLGTFGRHGANASMTLNEKHRAEVRAVRERFAPAAALQHRAYRLLLKAWLNGTNPRWFATKKVPRVLATTLAAAPVRNS